MRRKQRNEIDREAPAVRGEHTRTTPVITPEVDIYETPEALVLLADLPGVRSQELHIRLEGDTLTMEGDARQGADAGHYLDQEFPHGRFWRQFVLNEAIDRDQIHANMKNGELKLTLPKVQPAGPKRIEVQAA